MVPIGAKPLFFDSRFMYGNNRQNKKLLFQKRSEAHKRDTGRARRDRIRRTCKARQRGTVADTVDRLPLCRLSERQRGKASAALREKAGRHLHGAGRHDGMAASSFAQRIHLRFRLLAAAHFHHAFPRRGIHRAPVFGNNGAADASGALQPAHGTPRVARPLSGGRHVAGSDIARI